MNLNHYQSEAQQTDRVPTTSQASVELGVIVPLLGLAGEAGELLSEYKKFLRDGPAHRLFKERVAEELGDILWYVANVATKFGLNLETIAADNLKKTRDRWETANPGMLSLFPKAYTFDQGYPAAECLPRKMDVTLTVENRDGVDKIILRVNGEECGASLTDNAYEPDGYGFHDVMHFANAAVLGWSPVLRGILKCKRRSNKKVDEVEDGGRAAAIEEGIAAVVYAYACEHNFFDGITVVDYDLLRTVKSAARHLEVKDCSLVDWQNAILQGYMVWRSIVKTRGGRFTVDLDARTIGLVA